MTGWWRGVENWFLRYVINEQLPNIIKCFKNPRNDGNVEIKT